MNYWDENPLSAKLAKTDTLARHLLRRARVPVLNLIAANDGTALVCALTLLVASSLAASERVDFNRDVRPILSDNCFACHGPDAGSRQADLRLDTREGLFDARARSPIVVPGNADGSELIRRINSEDADERMPPSDSNRTLTSKQIALLGQWVNEGAKWQRHWAYETPIRPSLPAIRRSSWPRNEIDQFVLARIEQAKLAPSTQADKVTLIRRLTLDLTGLPPTPDQVDDFLFDKSVPAYEKLVDRLMASPAYGERMVWDWLDAARYADSNGYQGDPDRTMWPWRDLAVRALNDGMPFDQFTLEQLAGDLLPSATTDQKIATGFNRNHMHNGEGGRIAEETRIENVFDRAETTCTVWMAITMGCARCHDHKFDPFSQKEYYQFFAFFNNTSESGGGRGGQIAPIIDFTTPHDKQQLAHLQQVIGAIAVQVDEAEHKLFPHDKDESAADSPVAKGFSGNIINALQRPAAKRSSGQLHNLIHYFADTNSEYSKLCDELKQALEERTDFNAEIPRVMVMDEMSKPRETFVLIRGAYNRTGQKVTRGTPAAFPPLPDAVNPDRLALARWLIDPTHPLTARVLVNRYWQMIFGTGIVKTVDDFGIQGEKPSHPNLLDWMATELVRSNWDTKRFVRSLASSATYRQTSKISARRQSRQSAFRPPQPTDSDNRLLSRAPRYRLPSWILRDQALAVSGLAVSRIGGPPVKPYQPPGIWEEATFGKKSYAQDHGELLYRRSVYTFWRRIVGPTMFFDNAARQTCSVQVSRTNTPLHALVLLNETTYAEAARALAERVMRSVGNSPASWIELAFRRVTARRPRTDELEVLKRRFKQLKIQYAQEPESASRLLEVGESSHDRRLDPVQHAAMTGVCSLILNLDESLTKQ